MNPCELAIAITALAVTISEQLDDENLTILTAVLTQLSDTLSTILVQRELCNNNT